MPGGRQIVTMQSVPAGVCDNCLGKKRDQNYANHELDIVVEETVKKVRKSVVHCEFKNKHQKTDTEGRISSSISSGLPNFRRFNRGHDAPSDTMKEDEVINRFFRIMGSDFKRELRFPPPFIRTLNGDIEDNAILISCKGMWAVNLGICSCHEDFVLSGTSWHDFLENHKLELNDLVWFEQTDRMVFRVHVFDLSTCEKDLTDPFENLRSTELNGQAECKKKSIWQFGEEVTSCIKCSFKPDFLAYIEEHHLKHNYLTIPSEFLKRHDIRDKKMAILLNNSGHAWEIELAHYQDVRLKECSQRNMKLRTGWTAFFKSNNLQVGDILVLALDVCCTLTSTNNVVFRVRVVRAF